MARVSEPQIRILIVDDDPLVRAGLTMILKGADYLEIVGEAAYGVEALRLTGELSPDVVLMDIRMPHMDGLEATARIAAEVPAPKVIVLTTIDADDYVAKALRDGASGFLLKDTPPPQIVDAVRKVAAGDPILSPRVTAQLIRHLTADTASGPGERSSQAQRLLETLSDREREVAVCVGEGKANAEIAAELFMSVATVKAHVSRVLVKLQATNRVQIAIRVHDAGLTG
ncbi:MAG: response regulator [Nocardioidaceae bacterium]